MLTKKFFFKIFNEIFKKDLTCNIIKSHKKQKKQSFRKKTLIFFNAFSFFDDICDIKGSFGFKKHYRNIFPPQLALEE